MMRLLKSSGTGEFSLTKPFTSHDTVPSYAILSHTWFEDAQEPTFEDLINGTGGEKLGYKKLQFCKEQANRDGLQYFWVDTCCINKSNRAELSQAINSMFRWYRNATRCYVYLSDVTVCCLEEGLHSPWDSDLGRSRWFTRGWTLQELIAPRSIEFFSYEGIRIGDGNSLKQQIQQITGVPVSALQGARLSLFSSDERFLWMERRQTKVEEDKVYSLLGILDVEIPLYYGEGAGNASKRVREVIDKRERCTQDLRLTDPRDDKKRIEDTKGGLLVDSYRWILESYHFQQWRDNQQNRLLWIKGDPGKGKTMLLCGIIDELNKSMDRTALLSYFFCQATDSRINNATAVLRGLLYLLVDQQPSLISHIRKKHDNAGRSLFEDTNAWVTLSKMFTDVLQDPNLNSTCLIVDALDECVVGLPHLLKFISQMSSVSPRIKWIVSSRNWPGIKKELNTAMQMVGRSLELYENSMSDAVAIYIQFKVDWLAKRNRYTTDTRHAVQRYLSLNANGTFLWVALVCQEMSNISGWKAQQKLTTFPPGLDAIYRRMTDQIRDSEDADLCKRILAVVSTVYRPITLDELASFVDMLDGAAGEYEALSEIIGLCGSFLTLRERTISFIHQSAKDFLLAKASNEIFPSGKERTDHEIFSRSLKAMSRTLRRDIYNLGTLDCPIERVKQPDPDPLVALRYSSIYWVDHLHDLISNSSANHGIDPQDEVTIENFIREKYLYWLEALSLCRSISEGVLAIVKLSALAQMRVDAHSFIRLLQDARLFIMYHIQAIQNRPLQVYVSALIFTPDRSLIKKCFKKEELKWISKPAIRDQWSACLQTLEGHRGPVSSIAFSHDATRLVSGSEDKTIKLWDANSGQCLQTLGGHRDLVNSIAFSFDAIQLASASFDNTIKLWDASSGECLRTLEGHHGWFNSVTFSYDATQLASASLDNTIQLWDVSSGECLRTLEGHRASVRSVAFSHDATRLVSASEDKTAKVWDASNGECMQTLKGHRDWVNSVAFSHDATRIASACNDETVKLWDANSGECLRTLEGHHASVRSVAFSHDATRLASASEDETIKLWDVSSGECLQTLQGHRASVRSVAFSHDATRLVSASKDKTIKLWDANSGERLQTLEDHRGSVRSVAFSPEATRLASASDDKTVKLWDASSGECLQTLEGHRRSVRFVAISQNATQLASASDDKTVKLWDVSSGECLQTLEGHLLRVNSVAFSHDATRLASASEDETIKLWDASNGTCLQTLESLRNWSSSVTLSYDATRLASACKNKTAKLWDVSSGECPPALEGHSSSVRSVVFSHDSTRLASASDDKKVKVWDASSGECLLTLKGHRGSVNSVAFSHDATRLASASNDKTVKLWDASSGECLQTLEAEKALDNISFDISDSYLRTNIGVINLRPLADLKPQSPQYQGLALSADGVWITYNSENLIWIPLEYRPFCSVLLKDIVSIGATSGKVWICKIQHHTG